MDFKTRCVIGILWKLNLIEASSLELDEIFQIELSTTKIIQHIYFSQIPELRKAEFCTIATFDI